EIIAVLNDSNRGELVAFDVKFQNDKAMVHWSTSFQKSTSHFVIQRSIDGKTFDDVGILFTDGDGNSESLKEYKFPDNVSWVDAGSLYYRLKIVNLKGHYHFSRVINVKK